MVASLCLFLCLATARTGGAWHASSFRPHHSGPAHPDSGVTVISEGTVEDARGGVLALAEAPFERLSNNSKQWTLLQATAISSAAHPPPRSFAGAAVHNDAVAVFGGWDGRAALNDLWHLNISTMRWKRAAPLGTVAPAVQQHACVATANSLWLFGGHNGETLLSTVWRYHYGLETWSHVALHGPGPRAGHSWVLTADGRTTLLYGGEHPDHFSWGDLWELNLDVLRWHRLTDGLVDGIPYGRRCHSAVVAAQELLIFGGIDSQHIMHADVWEYLIVERKWRQMVAMQPPTPRHSHHAVMLHDGRMCVYGGVDMDGNMLQDVLLLDVGTKTWSQPQPSGLAPSPRLAFSLLPIGQQVAMFGGHAMHNTSHVLSELWWLDTFSSSRGESAAAWREAVLQGELPVNRTDHTTLLHGNSLLVFGGRDPTGNVLRDLWQYDLDTQVWSIPIAPTTGWQPTGRSGHVAGLFQLPKITELAADDEEGPIPLRGMVVFGGFDAPGQYLADLLQFSFDGNSWHVLKAEGAGPTARAHCSMIMHKPQELIIFGGIAANGQLLNDMWQYTIDWEVGGGNWKQIQYHSSSTHIPSPRSHAVFELSAFGSRLHLFGGNWESGVEEQLTIWRFDLVTLHWKQIKSFARRGTELPRRSQCVSFFYGDHVIMWGGFGEAEEVFTDLWGVEIDHPEWKRYQLLEGKPALRKGQTILKVGGKVLMYGGETFEGEVMDDIWQLSL